MPTDLEMWSSDGASDGLDGLARMPVTKPLRLTHGKRGRMPTTSTQTRGLTMRPPVGNAYAAADGRSGSSEDGRTSPVHPPDMSSSDGLSSTGWL
jgi:hypothetical protein